MKKVYKRLLIIEFLLFAVYIAFVGINHREGQSRLNVPLDAWSSRYTVFEDGKWQINYKNTDLNTPIIFLKGPIIEAPKGDYTVTVCYEADSNQSCKPYVYRINQEYLKCDTVILDKNANTVSFDFQITEDIDNLELIFEYNGQGNFTVSGISIDRNNNNIKRSFVYMLFFFIFIDVIVYYHFLSTERKRYLLVILGITFIASIPVFYTGLDGHDLIFHLMRIEGIARELSYGNFPVRISSAWMAEYGYPVSIYYGDVLLYIPAAFRMLGFTIDQAYKIFVLVMNFTGVVIAEQCFKRIFRRESTALLLTLVYVTASYRLVDVYIRTAVGEYCSLMFLPVIALAVYNIYCGQKNNTVNKNIRNALILALGMTGIITAHVLSAEMVAFAMLLVCLTCLKKTFTVHTIRTYVIAVAGFFLLSAGFLVPFMDYYLSVPVEITDTVAGNASLAIQEKGANIGDFFAFFSNPFGDWYTALFNPGLVLMLGLAVAIMLLWLKKATKEVKILTVLSGIMLFMATNVFPWNSLAHDFKIFNLLAQVQFPWRYIGIAIIFLTLLLGFILEQTDVEPHYKINKNIVMGICAVISIIMTCIFNGYYADYLHRNVYLDTANIDTWSIMGEEYLRYGTHVENLDGKIHMDGDTKYAEIVTRTGCEMDVQCKTGLEEGTVILPVLNYKGYQVTDDEGNRCSISDSEENLICINLPPNFEGMIYLRFAEPWYWTTAFAVSVISVFSVVAICVWDVKKRKYYIK